ERPPKKVKQMDNKDFVTNPQEKTGDVNETLSKTKQLSHDPKMSTTTYSSP
ncbi:9472_t:CDS:1, partial [Gigaspora rosea]